MSKNSPFKDNLTLLDMAIFPFIRQFAFIDRGFSDFLIQFGILTFQPTFASCPLICCYGFPLPSISFPISMTLFVS